MRYHIVVSVCRGVNCYISRVWELLVANSYTLCNSTSDTNVLCQWQNTDTWHKVYCSYWWVPLCSTKLI